MATKPLASRDLHWDRTWDARLMQGLMIASMAEEPRGALVSALGALGCEAEYGLDLLATPARVTAPTHAQAERWLRQCYQLGQRLVRLGDDLELAVQGFLHGLAALDARPPLMRGEPRMSDSWGDRFDATPGVWWPEENVEATQSVMIPWWLRRAGFAYRHSINLGLPEHFEALESSLALVMIALRSLPPSGVLTNESLAISLLTLSTDLEGDLSPHHLQDIDSRHIGLLTGIATLVRLSAQGQTDIEGDLAWARGELERAQGNLRVQVEAPASGARVTRPLGVQTGNLWARQLIAEWSQIIDQLTQIERLPAS